MSKVVTVKLPARIRAENLPRPPEPEPLLRPLSFSKTLELDVAHEEKRKRYGYKPTLPHLFQGDIHRDGRLIAKVYIYLPVEIDNNIRVKVEGVDPEIS